MSGEISMVDAVKERLEEAGLTLAALPPNDPRLGIKVCDYGYTREGDDEWSHPLDAFNQIGVGDKPRNGLPSPSREDIGRMEECFQWLRFIDNKTIRRIVALRSLVHPFKYTSFYSWEKLGKLMHVHHRSIQRWHEQGLNIIVDKLQEKGIVL